MMAKRKLGKPPVATIATSATRAGNEWGIPDWRDKDAYGEVKKWNLIRWRWEFYRRRDDLRQYFDDWADTAYRELSEGDPAFPKPCEPGFFVIVHADELKREFGYSIIPNPRIPEQPENLIQPYEDDGIVSLTEGNPSAYLTMAEILERAGIALSEEQSWRLSEYVNSFPIALSLSEAAIAFDLDRPLEAQLFAAKNHLRRLQFERAGKPLQSRRHPAKWLGYLRALDAREAGASWAIITEAFFAEGLLDRRKNPSGGYRAPDAQAARDVWEQANALRFKF